MRHIKCLAWYLEHYCLAPNEWMYKIYARLPVVQSRSNVCAYMRVCVCAWACAFMGRNRIQVEWPGQRALRFSWRSTMLVLALTAVCCGATSASQRPNWKDDNDGTPPRTPVKVLGASNMAGALHSPRPQSLLNNCRLLASVQELSTHLGCRGVRSRIALDALRLWVAPPRGRGPRKGDQKGLQSKQRHRSYRVCTLESVFFTLFSVAFALLKSL